MGAKPLPGLSRVAVSEGFVEARRLLEPLKQSHGVKEGSLGGGSALASTPESSPRTQGCTAPPSTLRLSEQPTWPNPGVSHSHLTSITAMRRGQEREGHSCPSPEPREPALCFPRGQRSRALQPGHLPAGRASLKARTCPWQEPSRREQASLGGPSIPWAWARGDPASEATDFGAHGGHLVQEQGP